MVCPVCPAAGLVGGYVGGYFGIDSPKSTELNIASAAITAGLIVITIVALRCIFGISLCDGRGDFSLRNIVQVGLITIVIGIIYSIVVNYLINLWFSEPSFDLAPPQIEAQPLIPAPRPCCCREVTAN